MIRFRTAISTLAMTVLLSVILHGLTADVLLGGTTAGSSGNGPVIETAPATEPRARRPMVPRRQNDV